MASFSDSIQKAQTLSVCQFCEESSIEWKCINCNLFLCQLCNSRIHSKLTIANEHHVINLEDCGSVDAVETSRKVDLEQLTCTIHSGEKCVLYCKNCEMSVCSDCLIKDHKNHDFHKLDKVYNEKLKDIKDMMHKFESHISHFKKKEKDLQKMLYKGNKQYSENRQEIIDIKDSIVEYADDLLSDLDKQWKPTGDIIKQQLDSVKWRKDELEKRTRQLDQTLSSSSASGIFVSSNCLDKSMPDKTVRHVELKERKFIPRKLSNQQISDFVGCVYNVPDIQLVQSYLTEVYRLSKLIKSSNNSAFIGSSSSTLLHKISLEQEGIKYEGEIKLANGMYDVAMMNNGDLLVSTKEQELKLYTTDAKIEKGISFFPLYTLCVHVNKKNEIYVGLSESADLSSPTKDSVRRIVHMNQKGQIIHSYEYDTDSKTLFSWPHRICINNQNIYVVNLIDNIPSGQGTVEGIEKGGQPKWTYKSCFDTFYPRDIAVTSTQMVIVTDCYYEALHVLSATGEIILHKVVKHLFIKLPYSLSIDKDDNLWVGTMEDPSNIYAIKLGNIT